MVIIQRKKRKGSNASIGYNSGNDSPKTPSKRSRSRTSSRGDLSSPRGGIILYTSNI